MSAIHSRLPNVRKRLPTKRSQDAVLTMDIPPKVLRAVTKLCYAKGKSRAEVVREVLVEHLQARGYL
jgi:hypothetical protein